MSGGPLKRTAKVKDENRWVVQVYPWIWHQGRHGADADKATAPHGTPMPQPKLVVYCQSTGGSEAEQPMVCT